MSSDNVARLVQKLAEELAAGKTLGETALMNNKVADNNTSKTARYTVADYPLMQKHREMLRSPSGKPLDEITLTNVMNGSLKIEDVRISKESLHAQADIAEDAGKPARKKNLLRAAELISVPDDVVIHMYDQLRPNRSTKAQLLGLAEELEQKYNAPGCASLVREACEVYEKRNILIKE